MKNQYFIRNILLSTFFAIGLFSCNNNGNEIEKLQEDLNKISIEKSNFEEIINDLNNEIRLLKTSLHQKNEMLEIYEKSFYELISDDYSFNAFLIDFRNMLPNGFLKTEGYLKEISNVEIGKPDLDIKNGFVFYITDNQNPLKKFIEPYLDNKIFFHKDKYGNLGLTLQMSNSDKEKLLATDYDNTLKVLLTLHDIFPISEPVFYPFATVYVINE